MILYQPYKPAVFLISDSEATHAWLSLALGEGYTLHGYRGEAGPPPPLQDGCPHVVVLDLQCPGPQGLATCMAIRALGHALEMPLVFLSADDVSVNEEDYAGLGAIDHFSKAVPAQLVQSRLRVHLAMAERAMLLRLNNEHLASAISQRTQQLALMQDTTILALASLAETRDVETGKHLRRTQHYVRSLANHLRRNPRYADYLSDETIDILFKCAPLHDIGKVGIPDRILLKPGRYEPEEFEVMKRHPTLGRDAILNAQRASGASLEFFEIAKDVVYTHHEKWNGSGYPRGLTGDEIPIPGRLMALADVYDALISPRIYKPGMTHEQASKLIVQGAGTHFDPDVVSAFLELSSAFTDIAQEFADNALDILGKSSSLNPGL